MKRKYSQDLSRRVEPVWRKETDPKTGKTRFVKIGENDVQDKINVASVGVTLPEILQRVAHGDQVNIPKAQPSQFVDTTKVPSSVVEARKAQASAVESFNKLPAGLRQKFGNSPSRFVSEMTDSILKAFVAGSVKVTNPESGTSNDLKNDGKGLK